LINVRDEAIKTQQEARREYVRTRKLYDNWERAIRDQVARRNAPNNSDNVDAQPDREIPANPHIISEEPPVIPRARPILLICPPELIHQWANEIGRLTRELTVLKYYGDKRTTADSQRITEKLTRRHEIFNGAEKNSRVVVITSLQTLRARHGPSELKTYRMSKLGFTEEYADSLFRVNDSKWAYNLEGLFDHLVVDEAHTLKNMDTSSHTTTTWMKARFIILATATVISNRIDDFTGYIKFIEPTKDLWTDENMAKWNIDPKTTNPFLLPDDHPAAVLRTTTRAVQKWITDEGLDQDKTGYYLAMIWKRIMIRRTYASPNPADPSRKIGQFICAKYTRRVSVKFNESEFMKYTALSEMPLKKLAMPTQDGKIVWNKKWCRHLILLSDWIGFHYVEKFFMAEYISSWKAVPDPLNHLLKKLRTAMLAHKEKDIFDLPPADDVPAQLSIICRGSPKLRALLDMIATIIILHGRKLIIWCSLPATQILINICLQALGIECACYTSDLSTDDRHTAVLSFASSREGAQVFIGSYYVGSVGLNLQKHCSHEVKFDTAPNLGTDKQASGRIYRMSQKETVESCELTNKTSFQVRQLQGNLMKAVPGAVAELDLGLEMSNTDTGNDEDQELVCSREQFYLVNGEIIEAPDPRLDGLMLKPLTPTQLILAILNLSKGENYDYEDEDFEVEDLAPGAQLDELKGRDKARSSSITSISDDDDDEGEGEGEGEGGDDGDEGGDDGDEGEGEGGDDGDGGN
jgi:hypothetical protein